MGVVVCKKGKDTSGVPTGAKGIIGSEGTTGFSDSCPELQALQELVLLTSNLI